MPAGQSSSPISNTFTTPQSHGTFLPQLTIVENEIRQFHPNTPQEVVRQMADLVLQIAPTAWRDLLFMLHLEERGMAFPMVLANARNNW